MSSTTSTSSSSSGGIGFAGLLTIAFIVLKLTDHIAWSWWWVLAPIWVSTLFVAALVVILLSVFVVKEVLR